MRLLLAIAGLCLWIWCGLTCPTNGMNLINSDFIYLPDQVEYVKLATVICPENTILWPGTRRCYREGEQGPCNIGRVLVFDRRLLKPYCQDVDFK